MNNFLEVLPFEIFIKILSELDYKSILIINKLTVKLSLINIETALRISIERETKFDTINYNYKQLYNLHRNYNIPINRHISVMDSLIGILHGSGTIYQVGDFESINLNPKLIKKLDLKIIIIQIISCGDYSKILLLTNKGLTYYITGKTVTKISNNIIQIAKGYDNIFALSNDGCVYDHNLGNYIPCLSDIIQISVNGTEKEDNVLALKSNGTVYFFGNNKIKQVNDYYIDRKPPTLIPNINNIIQVAAGGVSHSLVNNNSLLLTNEGKIYSFGVDDFGDDDFGRPVFILNVKLFNNLPKIINISAGINCSTFLTFDKKILTLFGDDIYYDDC